MAMADRKFQDAPGGGMLDQITPMVKLLLFANVGIYLLDTILKGDAPDGWFRMNGAFSMESAINHGKIWEFVTFQFIHGSILHILFNSIGLFFFGPWMERWWGSNKFLGFYLLSGAGGAAFFALLVYTGILPAEVPAYVKGLNAPVMIPMSQVPLVGASAGIYGILMGVAVIAPSLRVSLLFPPITLSMRQLALAIIAIAVASIVFRFGGNEGGEAGHLGGAIVGYLLVAGTIWHRKNGGFGNAKSPRTDIEPKIRPRTRVDLRGQSEIDAILDKISSEGFQSLTEEERDMLHRAAKKDDN